MLTIYVAADNLIRWDSMQLASTGVFVNDATVTFTLKSAAGAAVAGATAIAMPYVAASNGRYEGVLESTVSLTVGATYYLEVTATSGGANGFRRIECAAFHEGD
jgi:hypothetical protein